MTAPFVLLGAIGAFLVWACRHVGVKDQAQRDLKDEAEASWVRETFTDVTP
jgi:hypothetical protein